MMKASEIKGIAREMEMFDVRIQARLEDIEQELPCMLYKGIDSKGRGTYDRQEIQSSVRDENNDIIEDGDDYFNDTPVETYDLITIFRKAKKLGGKSVAFWTLFEWRLNKGDDESFLTDVEYEIEFDLRGNVLYKSWEG